MKPSKVEFDRKTINKKPIKPVKPIKKVKEPNKFDRSSILTEEGEAVVDKITNFIFNRGKHKKGKGKIVPKPKQEIKKPISEIKKPVPTNKPVPRMTTKPATKPTSQPVRKSQPSLTDGETRTRSGIPKTSTPRKFQYTKPVRHGERTGPRKEVVIEEIKEEKVIVRRPKLETVRDLNELSFLQKINLVSYFNQKESGKLDERQVREEYLKNTKLLQKENSLKYMLLESARRNLEYGEFPEIKLQIDPRLKVELASCINSKLLSSYEIKIERQHEILTEMNVDPIIISMKLKVLN